MLWLMIRFGLANLQVYLPPSWISTMKLAHAPAGNVDNYPFTVCKWKYYDCVFLCCAVTTRWDHFRDMHITWHCDSYCTQSFKNNPGAGNLFSKGIMFRKNGSTVFKIFHGRPQLFCFNGAKKLSHSKYLLVS